MILKKIYFYRESALELFTESKSYFFNFFSENSFSVFMSEIEKYISSSKDYLAKKSFYLMPIIINPQDKEKKRNIGYIKINEKFERKSIVNMVLVILFLKVMVLIKYVILI